MTATKTSIDRFDKAELLADLKAQVDSDLEDLKRRQQDVADGATHEESRSEHAKDTRATEQSYLARGLAKRVEELTRTRDALAALTLRTFREEDGEAIAVGAIVTLRDEGDEREEPDENEIQRVWLVPGGRC